MLYLDSRELVYSESYTSTPTSPCREDSLAFSLLLSTDSLWEYHVSGDDVSKRWQIGEGEKDSWSLKRNQFPVYDMNEVLYLRRIVNVRNRVDFYHVGNSL